MKTIFRYQLLFFLVAALFASNCFAQNNSDTLKKYRVIAVARGNDQITSTSNISDVHINPLYLYVPNAFTPNGDGLNDTFGGIGSGIKDYKMQIFNRWGHLIFESNNIHTQWDGKYKGQMCQTGAYVYQIVARGETSGFMRKTGTVDLLQ